MEQRQTAALASVTSSAAIKADGGGFLPGVRVVADVLATTAALVGACQWQTSQDGTTGWANTGTAFAGGIANTQVIVLGQYNRLNVTAYTSGTVVGRLISDT